GGLDFLINNAAIIRDRTIAKMSAEEWQAVMDVNLTGVFICCKHGLEIMRDGGAIVSLGSIAAILGFFGQTNYAAAKAGVIALSKSAAKELARHGITVNVISPGLISTDMLAGMEPAVLEDLKKNIPVGRIGEPADIAGAALFLASDAASYITGQVIRIDGGLYM
ncbi:MAG: SDR family oxidoreductase, partial [bacterium]